VSETIQKVEMQGKILSRQYNNVSVATRVKIAGNSDPPALTRQRCSVTTLFIIILFSIIKFHG